MCPTLTVQRQDTCLGLTIVAGELCNWFQATVAAQFQSFKAMYGDMTLSTNEMPFALV